MQTHDFSARASVESMQAVRLKRLSAETEQLANKDIMCSEISQVVENLQEKDKKDAGSLEEMRVSLQTVEYQIQMLKSEYERLVKIRERKNMHVQWLKKEKKARSGEDQVMQGMIADTEEAVVELSEKVIGLENKIDAFTHDKEVINEEILKQEVGKKQLEIELGKKQEELESFKRETKLEREHLEEKIDQLTHELFENKVKFYSINNTIDNSYSLRDK